MKSNIKKTKIYTCAGCNKKSEVIGIEQKETHYYSMNLSTNQMEDFHGDESVESQKFFCIGCNKKISERDSESLL